MNLSDYVILELSSTGSDHMTDNLTLATVLGVLTDPYWLAAHTSGICTARIASTADNKVLMFIGKQSALALWAEGIRDSILKPDTVKIKVVTDDLYESFALSQANQLAKYMAMPTSPAAPKALTFNMAASEGFVPAVVTTATPKTCPQCHSSVIQTLPAMPPHAPHLKYYHWCTWCHHPWYDNKA